MNKNIEIGRQVSKIQKRLLVRENDLIMIVRGEISIPDNKEYLKQIEYCQNDISWLKESLNHWKPQLNGK